MTPEELLRRMLLGHFILVGEVRAADVGETGFVDTKTGLSAKILRITYFVELPHNGAYEIAKIIRFAPRGVTDPAQVPVGVEKGRRYAFDLDSIERKHGFLHARMRTALPELIEFGVPPLGAPAGAPAAAP